ncbi:Rz1-like lysis system protein LysC [Yersinia sp. Marseille-Q3913]|uniref:Rz1-like lysis system protein LysC n=1 Tax=Yersinia sp. Marseille-Q3913 TaxID=2830769 RepID=UPI00403FDE85
MKVNYRLHGLRQQRRVMIVLSSLCLVMSLASCANKPAKPLVTESALLLPPESALTPCEVPEFTGITWGDGGLYAMELKRELRICKGRLDEVIDWRQRVGSKT